MLRAIIVNVRVPRHELDCSVCGRAIKEGFAVDLGTRIKYCSFDCFGVADTAYVTAEEVQQLKKKSS